MTAPVGDDLTWLDDLERAHAAATPGPWTAATAPAEGSAETHAEYLTRALDPDAGRPLWVAWAATHRPEHDDLDYVVPVVTGDGPASEANARYLAAIHDAVPTLIAELRKRDAALERIEALAEEYDDEADAADAVAEEYDHAGFIVTGGLHQGRARELRDAANRTRAAAALTPESVPT